jgi:hypothetical protein
MSSAQQMEHGRARTLRQGFVLGELRKEFEPEPEIELPMGPDLVIARGPTMISAIERILLRRELGDEFTQAHGELP